MEIKVEDYLTEEEIKSICQDAIYQKIREDMRRLNIYDIISNISYAEVYKMVDTFVGESDYCKNAITEKVPQLIDSLSAYSVFRKADAWERSKSVGQEILDEEVGKSRPLIKKRIEQIVAEYDFPELSRNEIMFTLADTLTNLFFKDKED